MGYSRTKPITCYQAQLLMDVYIANDSSLTVENREAFEAHLQTCPECAEEYEQSKFVIALVKRYWPVSENTLSRVERANQPAKRPLTVEGDWKDLLQRCPDLGQRVKRCRCMYLFRRLGAVAACFVIGVSIYVAFSPYSKIDSPQGFNSQSLTSGPNASVTIELLSDNGNITIPTNVEVRTASNELKTLIIDGKHRLMMNCDTILAVIPLTQNTRLGCAVNLRRGEVFAHVKHDGNPFIVRTAHGQAVIRGTAFDVKATEDTTTLVVAEGNVRFESEKGCIEVAAGQISEIFGQLSPSKPVQCNPAELTAWATDYKSEPTLAQSELNTDPWQLPLSLRKERIVLEETDYDSWVVQKRDWFKQEFPWIFQLKDALAKRGIEVDYPELSIETGDVWQFVCLEVAPARFSAIDPNSLLNIASNYGFDKQWLLENVPVAKSALEKPVLPENSFTGLKAFERWLEYLDETKGLTPPTPIYSFRAGKYLANTRSLIWFAVRDDKYDLTDEERAEVLVLLQEEVTAACNCQNDEMYPLDKQEKPSCGEEICQKPVDRIVGHIEAMKVVEARVSQYEIGK